MYHKLKACLFGPKNIVNYVDEPKSRSVWYTIFLLVCFVLPAILIVSFSQTVSSTVSTEIVKDFREQDTINYEIKDGILIADETVGTQFVETEVLLYDQLFSLAFVFDSTNENYDVKDSLKNSKYVLFVFGEKEVKVLGNFSDIGLKNLPLYSKTYKQLGIDNINFDKVESNATKFNMEINGIINTLYSNIKNSYIISIIFILVIAYAISYFLFVLFIALVEKLLYMGYKIPFGKTFKIVILCSTPYVVFSILSTLVGWYWLSLLGQLLMVFYTMVVLTSYRLRKTLENKE